jgi:molecular chaperone Hsp33
MSELHTFLFDGLPVRGTVVRLTDAWTELQKRQASGGQAHPEPVRQLLGELTAAAVLMQSNIKFDGALVLQIFGDGPLKVAVVEVQSDLQLRATAKVVGEVPESGSLAALVNVSGQGRCAITLDPADQRPGVQPYQGVVSLSDPQGQPLSGVSAMLEHYMRQSEQLDTTLVLAANADVAAGLLIQRLPVTGSGNLQGQMAASALSAEAAERLEEDYRRIAILAASLTPVELLTLDVNTLLHRLFWQENVLRYEPRTPRFACRCSRERVSAMLRTLGPAESESILQEQGRIEVACDFCGQSYTFDAVDTARIFQSQTDQPPGSQALQ